MQGTYKEKVQQWREFTKSKNIPANYAGFPTLLFFQIGKEPQPLLFWKFSHLAILLGINYALMWGILMHIVTWRKTEIPVLYQLISSLLAGLIFGLFMAILYKRHFKKHRLVSWDTYHM